MKVQITEGGKAKEVNPLGERPKLSLRIDKDEYAELGRWRLAEAALKTYEIDEPFKVEPNLNNGYKAIPLIIGSIHEAELLTNGKIKIL